MTELQRAEAHLLTLRESLRETRAQLADANASSAELTPLLPLPGGTYATPAALRSARVARLTYKATALARQANLVSASVQQLRRVDGACAAACAPRR